MKIERIMSKRFRCEFESQHIEHQRFGTQASLLKGLAVLILSMGLHAQATLYYVDSGSGSDSNSGTSTSSAWAHLPGSMNLSGSGWVVIQNGDTIYVKGGSVNTVELYVRSTSSKYNGAAAYDSIKIIGGDQIGWGTGKPVYDMQNIYTSGFWIQQGSGITVDGFEVRNIKAGAVGPGFDDSTG